MKKSRTERRPPPVDFAVTKISVSPEGMDKLMSIQRCKAVEAYKERLIMEMTIMSTRGQLAVVKGAIRRIKGFI